MAKKQIESKLRIFKSARKLFAQKGFHAVGVREIAETADVNISMISYYYGGKTGILKKIISDFLENFEKIMKSCINSEIEKEEVIRNLVKKLVTYFRQEVETSLVTFNTISLDFEEINEFRVQKVKKLIMAVTGVFKDYNINPKDPAQLVAIGPSILALLLTHFRLASIQEKVLGIPFDDDFYEKFSENISTFIISGVIGVVTKNQLGEK